MSNIVDSVRDTALNSTYSREREDAIERLSELYTGELDDERRHRILETYREIIRNATYSDERDLAKEKLLDLFDHDPDRVAPVAVRAFRHVATEARHLDKRTDAMNTLAQIARADIEPDLVAAIRDTYDRIAEEATRERERSVARERLTELKSGFDGPVSDEILDAPGPDAAGLDAGSVDGRGTSLGSAEDESDQTPYLAESLADHLINATTDGPDACLQRAEELRDFVTEHDRSDEAYEDILESIDELVEQLEVVATNDSLDEERRDRVRRLAKRTKQLYRRN